MGPAAPDCDSLREGLEALEIGLSVWGADRRLVYANPAFRDALGAADVPLAPDTGFEAFLAGIERSHEWVLPDERADWAVGRAAAFGQTLDAETMLADGRTLAVVQRPTASGGMTMTLTDVSAAKQSQSVLRIAKEKAEATDEAKSRFLRAANHDLRQPLATLRILIYNCREETDEEHRGDLLHAMDMSVSVMEDLLGALLQIGQLDAGHILPRVTTFQLAQVFARLDNQFRHQAAEKGLRLRLVETRGAVTSDRALLERILSNLVANAIRYTEYGGVLIGCRRVGTTLRIEVRDTGRGIAAEHRDKIFDEFYRVPDAMRSRKQGLGLGLNIVKRLASLLGHPLSLSSREAHGTTFAITVPIGNVWHSDVGEPEISEMVGGQFVDIVVLVVEDDDVLRDAMQRLLERWGMRVHAAGSEAEAYRSHRSDGLVPQLIVADYSLRGQTGTQVVRKLREMIGRPVPGIIVTADTEPRIVAAVKAQGFPIMMKPISPPRLRVLMHNLLFEPNPPEAPASTST